MKLLLDLVREFQSAAYFVRILLTSAFVCYFGRGSLAERGE
jgi:hypothetical protein